ncbi:MAG: DUF6090 family protein [Allomuricauda sp.]|uniref:Uncharacterized protein n=1 Tax=Flagellimonas profundi TaxID=2915620 RepID=A0ABS3FDW7_9FLAO|nr:DUF6090 family protein [Allomuricauda profundi]MBO0341343.1 hypothetical protein [Allomuricauda profundi]
MFKFFRTIRQRLLSENKFSKYLIYAIGEIILVVIGILIALRINNWNENQKLLQEEKATLASLKLEFQKNLTQLEVDIQAVEAFISAGNKILEHTGPDYEFGTLQHVDSLISVTPRMAVWDPSLYTLNNIKSSGKLSSLSNEELKILLIEWESFYSNLLDWGSFYVERGNTYFDYLMEHSNNRNLSMIGPIQFSKSKFDLSNEALLRQPEFENILVHRVTHNAFMFGFYQEAKARLTAIIAQCETYEDIP